MQSETGGSAGGPAAPHGANGAARWDFLNDAEASMVLPVVALVERRLAGDTPLEQAAELYSRAQGEPVDELVFLSYFEHWQALGASEDMILAACAIIAARPARYRNVQRAVSKILSDLCGRAAGDSKSPLRQVA